MTQYIPHTVPGIHKILGQKGIRSKSGAVPATVGGEPRFRCTGSLAQKRREGRESQAATRKPGNLPCAYTNQRGRGSRRRSAQGAARDSSIDAPFRLNGGLNEGT